VNLTRLLFRIRRQPPENDSATLSRVIADLDHLNRNTEQDFLRIGGKLAEFIATVDLISSGLTSLTNVISLQHGPHASEALTGALDRSTEMAERAEKDNRLLGKIHHEANRLSLTLSGFQETVSTFHTLGVLTRIETARLGGAGAGFGALADEVKLLAENVQARIENALDTGALLIPQIESAMQNISALEEGQAKDLPTVISGVQARLASVRDAQDRAQHSSVRLGTEYRKISDGFRQLVVSLQFHDITRQQVEHVNDVLRRVCSQLAEDGQPDLACVLGLQSSQLAAAAQTFASSTDSVSQSLDDIATQVGKMAEECRALAGISDDEKNSFFTSMEQGCAAILDSFSRCAANEDATRESSASLQQTIAKMRGSVDEIREIEIHMQRMALNGGIRAAHIGAPGDTLGVLAGSMQQLALDSHQLSDSLVETLNSMSDGATRLSDRAVLDASCLDNLRKAAAELHSSTGESAAQVAQIVACAVRLREELSAAGERFSVGALFAQAAGNARELLGKLIERHPSSSPQSSLTDFAAHYTMQAEHDVHRSVTMGASAVPPESKDLVENELGDNVELF
jgi:methyl-accepting chemotaxis protein